MAGPPPGAAGDNPLGQYVYNKNNQYFVFFSINVLTFSLRHYALIYEYEVDIIVNGCRSVVHNHVLTLM